LTALGVNHTKLLHSHITGLNVGHAQAKVTRSHWRKKSSHTSTFTTTHDVTTSTTVSSTVTHNHTVSTASLSTHKTSTSRTWTTTTTVSTEYTESSATGQLRGPCVIPSHPEPRTETSVEGVFFTPSFFYALEEASSETKLLSLIKADLVMDSTITQAEYDSFNTRWTVPAGAFSGSYDYVSVDYHRAAFAIQALLADVLQISSVLPQSDIEVLVADFIYCRNQQQLKIFLPFLWNQPASTTQMSANLGLLSAVCHQDSIEILAYKSSITVDEVQSVTVSDSQRLEDEQVLIKWLALHFAAEFN